MDTLEASHSTADAQVAQPAQSAGEDEWARWRRALTGEKLDLGERGNPPSGYFRFPIKDGRQEAIAVWRDEDGVQCARNIFGDGSGMTPIAIDDLFASEHYAVPYDVWQSVIDGGDWPALYKTRLRTKDITAGIVWTEAWARARLAENVETHDEGGNPRAVVGGNNPPADLDPPQALAARILAIGKQLAAWLETIGGKATSHAHAEMLGNYANKFKDCENEAVAAHKVEKQPHLDAGREVDAKWFAPVRDKAIASRTRTLSLIKQFTDAEDARRTEEARAANEAAAAAARSAAKTTDAAPEPVPQVVPERTRVSTLRGGGGSSKAWLVTGIAEFVAYCAKLEPPPPDLVDACGKIARKFGPAGVKAPGMEFK